ncbi:MAG: hydratase [Oscillospiraceae bacterium]|jgi:aconitate hydratase|nr:hydratase [Oscillospiraceae bacterium]
MIRYSPKKVYIAGDSPINGDAGSRDRTKSYQILSAHNKPGTPEGKFRITFDALMSHDITYVSIIQTARASGMTEFPLPYILTNCHNSLCAVGGTINADDHAFGLSAAKKYGGTYVPPNAAVCHQYMREYIAAPGKMILGSDSHTRYGHLGTMGIGEGGGELVKQLLRDTYDVDAPEVILVWLTGELPEGVGPHDAAISMVAELFPDGRAKNKVLEFAGPGVASLSEDYKANIDVMTTETSCLSSIWVYDISEIDGAAYDGFAEFDLSSQEPMIALPFHPSNAVTLREFTAEPLKYLEPLGLADKVVNGKVYADQGIICGCSGGLTEQLTKAAELLPENVTVPPEFEFSVYPASAAIAKTLTKNGVFGKFLDFGAVVKPAFCGPCFGAGDTPPHKGLSIRHATRNFPNREGSKPGDGQAAFVALMDALSIAATAANGGVITAANDAAVVSGQRSVVSPETGTALRAVNSEQITVNSPGAGTGTELRIGPNIADWPEIAPLPDVLRVKLCASIQDDVTTTDELIPSGETSSYRSNPLKLAEFTLSRRCPDYVRLAKDVPAGTFSAIFARKPGDGSAREQAASCQAVLNGKANFAVEYATKRYRSNLINWGIVPFTVNPADIFSFLVGTEIEIPNLREQIRSGKREIAAYVGDERKALTLYLHDMTESERRILLNGCLMNDYRQAAIDI